MTKGAHYLDDFVDDSFFLPKRYNEAKIKQG